MSGSLVMAIYPLYIVKAMAYVVIDAISLASIWEVIAAVVYKGF
jgi:hypothetical protein